MLDGLAPLDPAIAAAMRTYRAAVGELHEATLEAQRSCQHPQVLHVAYRGEYRSNPVRLCVCCRFEERGTLHSDLNRWSAVLDNSVPGLLGNAPGRLLVQTVESEIAALRLPVFRLNLWKEPEAKT